ncbi:hypothetical protein ACWD7T_04315 [Streptomyces sp. 900116325]
MPGISTDIPDLHVLLAEEGALELGTPQTETDVIAAVDAALAAVKQAYRVAYAHADGDTENDTVDDLDLAGHVLISIASDLQ